jgi:hypothetical protein
MEESELWEQHGAAFLIECRGVGLRQGGLRLLPRLPSSTEMDSGRPSKWCELTIGAAERRQENNEGSE